MEIAGSCHDKRSFKNNHLWERFINLKHFKRDCFPSPFGGDLRWYWMWHRCKLYMRLTWLNLRVKATTFGAELCFSFLFQPQLDSSWKHTWKLTLCTEPQHLLVCASISLNVLQSNQSALGGEWRGGRQQDILGEESRWGGRKKARLRIRSSQRLRQINGWL